MSAPQKYYLNNKNGFKINSNSNKNNVLGHNNNNNGNTSINNNRLLNNNFNKNNNINTMPNQNNNTNMVQNQNNNTNMAQNQNNNTNIVQNQNNNTFKTDNITNIIKKIIIDYIYNKIELKEYKFIQINNSSNILDLKNSKYYISPNYGGVPSLLVFLKYDNEYHSYLIDRRSLSFKGIGNENNANFMLNTIRMTKINLSVDIKFYDGSLFDCCLIDNVYNDQIQIIINDIFYFSNKNFLTVNYKKKIYIIKTIIDTCYKNEKHDNACLHISPVYELNKIKELFTDYMGPNITYLNIKGITFYPKVSSTKLIYIFDRLDNQYKEDIINNKIEIGKENNFKNEKEEKDIDINEDDEYSEKVLKFELSDITYEKDIILNFEMRKTKKSDVYKLYSIFNINEKFYKKKIGTPYIPSYLHTLKCKKIFEKCESVIVECLFHPYKGLWVPQNISDIKKIDIINKDNRIKITETIIKNNLNDEIM
jgi:hypothetical protein